MKKWILLFILTLEIGSSLAFAAVTIEAKHHELLKSGWSATFLKCADPKETESKWRYNDAPDIFSAGIKSVHSCQGTGNNFCFYYYEKNDQCLKLVTSGEFSYKGIKGLIVERELFQCPEKC